MAESPAGSVVLDEIGEWRLRHNSFFVSVIFDENRAPRVTVTDALCAELDGAMRDQLLGDLAGLAERLAAHLRARLESKQIVCTCGHKDTDHNTLGHCAHCECDHFAPLGSDQTGEVEIIIDSDDDKPPEAA